MKKYLVPVMILILLPGIISAQAYLLGDVNHNGKIEVVDALMTAQYYVGLIPAGFYLAQADVDAGGSVTIIDALMIAQYYVGLITRFPGQPQPTNPPTQTGLIGYAIKNGGTTGGAAGPTVTVSNSTDFKEYAGSHDPYVIQVQGTIDLGSQIYVRENKTIIGLGANATIVGGLKISNYQNLILRNLTIRGSNNDGLTIQNSQHVWVDHCTFIDSSDGQLDIVHASDWITVSWCKFYYTSNHGHNFVNLIGHDDGNGAEDSGTLHVTFHHNWWSTLSIERMPSIRYATVHLFNNYFNAPGNNYCIRTRIGAEVLVENNYFENVKNPWERFVTKVGGTPGKLRASGNIEVNTTRFVNPEPSDDGNQSFLIPGDDAVFTPPYSYLPDAASVVKNAVMAGAGPTG